MTKKEADAPGVVGIDDGRHRYRVRLGSDEEYHEAVMAHDKNREIAIEGELSFEGTLRWLYSAQLLHTVPDHPSPDSSASNDNQPNDLQDQPKLW